MSLRKRCGKTEPETQKSADGVIEDGLQYFAYAGDGVRFRGLFLETWRRVPSSTKGLIRRHLLAQAVTARVELMKEWSGWRRTVRGQVQAFAGEIIGIRFHGPYMDRCSDADVRFTIAHELAHIAQIARGAKLTRRNAERDADAKALRWLRLTRRPSRTAALREYDIAELAEDLSK